MKIKFIRGLYNFTSKCYANHVVTIGSYDGIHLGHQRILQRTVEIAHEYGLPSMVIIFEPQPWEYFHANAIARRLMSLREKLLLFERYGIDKVLCLRFDANLVSMPAQDFVNKILLDVLHTKFLVIGNDFHFGAKRLGDATWLKTYLQEYECNVELIEQFKISGQRVSSTLIRNALATGDLEKAQLYLGRPYSILGRIVHGDARGRKLNFPTANVYLPHKLVPLSGVYVIRAYDLAELPLYGVANVGFRPTVSNDKRLLEFYLLDFNNDLYGKLINVEFLHRLRDAIKFANLDLLRQQIAKDVEEAVEYLQL